MRFFPAKIVLDGVDRVLRSANLRLVRI